MYIIRIMDYYCEFTDDELKFLKDDFNNIVGGVIIKSLFYTYKQPFYHDDIEHDYNGSRYGWIIPQESRESIQNVIIYNIDNKKLMEGVKNPRWICKGECNVSLDVSSCRTNKSRLYFTFKLFKENCYVLFINRRDTRTTPKKRFRSL
jgi:hypothetical protein